MSRVLLAERKAAVLAPSQLACLAWLPTVNLTAGCAHNCLYCYARSYSQNPGEGRVVLHTNTLEKLRKELPRKRSRPRTVYFSPSCDVFQPVPEVLDLAYEVLAFLLRQGIGVAFLTKGRIPDRHMELLVAHAPLVHGGIGLTTLERHVWEVFEPNTAPPDVRVAQIGTLIQARIGVQVRLDPILPGVTDDERTVAGVFATLARLGVRDVAISTAFMRPPIIRTLKRHVRDKAMAEVLLSHYTSGPTLTMHGAGTAILVPPASTRKAIYRRVGRIAARYAVPVRICACKNGDLSEGSCHIAGDESGHQGVSRQGVLFE
jgi:DNA repair photolyase